MMLSNRWRQAGLLYKTPPKMNDDWFWLYGSVWSTEKKNRTLVITNDQMRDHHFLMLQRPAFLKWRERHVVHFHFESRSRSALPTFLMPLPWSERLQRSSDPSTKMQVWHAPLKSKASSSPAPCERTTGSQSPAGGTTPNDLSTKDKRRWLCLCGK